MQRSGRRQPLDRQDGFAGRGSHRGQTTPDGLPVQQHGAGAAQTGPTSVFGAHEPEGLAQHVKQRVLVPISWHIQGSIVDTELHGHP